jgi:hypothetical protein
MTDAVSTTSGTGVTERIRSVEKRVEEEFAAVRIELAAIHNRIDNPLNIRERLAALEAKIAARS